MQRQENPMVLSGEPVWTARLHPPSDDTTYECRLNFDGCTGGWAHDEAAEHPHRFPNRYRNPWPLKMIPFLDLRLSN